jgi:predicted dithiol-disulfide oxidoreductase (DUF899 family)
VAVSESPAVHRYRFPNESGEYRAARNRLLQAERDLRAQTEAVAALRRTLPLSGEIPHDYVFERASPGGRIGENVRMSELFTDSHDTLLVYSFMYGPAMERACPSCTSILDALDGAARHVTQRVAFAVVAKSPPQRIADHARDRGWRELQLLSSAGNSFNRDYHAENDAGEQMPLLHVFARRGAAIRHFTSTELFWAPGEPGQDMRHVDFLWPLWNLLDYTPKGRGESWGPQLEYGAIEGN